MYSAYPGKNKNFAKIDSKTGVQIRNDCANLCSINKDCGSCFWNEVSKNCDLYAEEYVNPHEFEYENASDHDF